MNRLWTTLAGVVMATSLASGEASSPAWATQQDILDSLRAAASSDFSAKRGKELFEARSGTGKPDTPSCTTCHGNSPNKTGLTRAGKEILPMAHSLSPERYSDPKKVEKWFRRNCKGVLGRECTAKEKGDFITFMMSQ